MILSKIQIHTIEDRLMELEEAAACGQYPKAPVTKLRKAYIRYCTEQASKADEKLLTRVGYEGEIE